MVSGGHMVIIGAGHAGGRAAEAMRAAGFGGPITLFGAEPHVPYERPPLSKELLTTDEDPAKTWLNGEEFYEENRIDLRLSTPVEAIERDAKEVRFAGGALAYDRLLIATGGRVRQLAVPGAELAGVHYLRTLDDSIALRRELSDGVRVAVVGGGFIGLEVAASARMRGCEVTVIELADQVLARVADPVVGDLVARLHRAHGVHVITGASVERLEGNGRVAEVVCTDGETVDVDMAVIGVGIAPDTGLAEAAGLEVGNGVLADKFGRTSDPDIFAVGDVACHYNPILGRHQRLESWANAQNGGIAVARNMVLDEPVPYAEVPWFWSDQFDLNLQVAGAPAQWDRIVTRGDPEAGQGLVFYMEGTQVVGATAFNMGREMRPCRQLIEGAKEIGDESLADEGIRLRDLAR